MPNEFHCGECMDPAPVTNNGERYLPHSCGMDWALVPYDYYGTSNPFRRLKGAVLQEFLDKGNYPQHGYEYIAKTYGVTVWYGTRLSTVHDDDRIGVVVGADHHIYVRLDGEKQPGTYHPNDIRVNLERAL